MNASVMSSSEISQQFVSNELPEDPCVFQEHPHLLGRFILVAIIGTTIAVVNILENIFLCCMLFSKKSYRSSHFLYLGLLAFFDIFIAGAYIPLMSLNHVVDYFRSTTLLKAWFSYMIPMITISHIAMTASSFLMVAASFERYCVTVRPQYTKFLNRHRFKIAAGSVFLGVLTKITHGFEFKIIVQEQCKGTMNEFQLELSQLAMNETYSTFWKIWIRSVFTILLPFFLLASMNIRIVLVISQTEFQFLSAQKLSDAKRKSRIRDATKTLVFVVFTYLLSNVLNVIITIWEYIDMDGLLVTFMSFYMIAVDVVSLLTILAGAFRLPIYMCCQSELRKEFVAQIKKLFYWSPYKNYNQTTMTMTETLDDVHRSDQSDQSEDEPRPFNGLFLQLGTVIIKKDNADTITRKDTGEKELHRYLECSSSRDSLEKGSDDPFPKYLVVGSSRDIQPARVVICNASDLRRKSDSDNKKPFSDF